MANNGTAVNNIDIAAEIENLARLINNQGYKLLDLDEAIRHLDMRVDQITPSTLNLSVIPTSKIITAGVIVGAALGGYIAYVEVTRRLKQKQQADSTES